MGTGDKERGKKNAKEVLFLTLIGTFTAAMCWVFVLPGIGQPPSA